MDDWEIYQEIEKELAEFKSPGFRDFIRPDGKGASHSLEFPGNPSAINTADLARLLSHDVTYCADCREVELETWRNEVLIPELRKSTSKLDANNPKLGEYQAYRVAQVLRAVPDVSSKQSLTDWLFAYLKAWLLREDSGQVSVFLVYLCADALDHLSDTVSSKLTGVQAVIQRFAEVIVSKQVSIGASELRTDLDAIDLALALSMTSSAPLAPGIVGVSLNLLNKAVANEGLWTNRQPILRIGSGIGCSAFEACLALLKSKRLPNVFTTLREALLSHWRWLGENRSATSPWRVSDLYLREPNREAWFNCLAVEFLTSLRERLYESKQLELRAKYRARMVESGYAWEQMVLGDEEKTALRKAFVDPLKGTTNPAALRESTALLFGPPGTTKTTIAETIAKEVSWPFIELGVADFLRDGLERVFAAAIQIFDDLLRLQNVVVLLDEVEGVFAERTQRESDLRQKFLTSALLPPLKRIRERKRIILIIATNYVQEFDQAIRRLGRIDLIVGVGPPDRNQRAALLREIVGLSDDVATPLAGLLPRETTIGEIKWIKDSSRPAGLAGRELAMQLFEQWKARFLGRQEIGDTQFKDFNEQLKKYSRLG
jgi:hypothetical protein